MFVSFKVIVVLLTVILQLDSAPFILAVIVTLPDFLASTFPYVLTDAIFESLLFHVGSAPVEVSATRYMLSPIARVSS